MNIKDYIVTQSNWPRLGVNFLDIGGVLANADALTYCGQQIANFALDTSATSVVAVESRGFPFAGIVSHLTGLPMIMVRKKNKLPGTCYSATYQTEYSQDSIEIQTRARPGIRPLIIDDLLATGGTVVAVSKLLKLNFEIDAVLASVVINLKFLPGEQELSQNNIDFFSVVDYE